MTEAFQHDAVLSPEQVAWDVDFALRHVAAHIPQEVKTAWLGQRVVLHTLESGEELSSTYMGKRGLDYSFLLTVESPRYDDYVFAKVFQQVWPQRLLAKSAVTVEEVVEYSAAPLDELDRIVHELHYGYVAAQAGPAALRFAERMHAEGHQLPGIEAVSPL